MAKKWIVETPTSLWLAEGDNAAAAIASVRTFLDRDELAYAAPLPRLRYGMPREIHFPDDRWERGDDARDGDASGSVDDTELEPTRPMPADPAQFGETDTPRHSE